MEFKFHCLLHPGPEMFTHDPKTNRLRLQPGKSPPWIRKTDENLKSKTHMWIYCIDCKTRWCPDTKQRPKAHIPFRDRASQMNLRPLVAERSDDAQQQATQPEPEPEDQAEEHFECDAPQAYEAVEQAEDSDDE